MQNSPPYFVIFVIFLLFTTQLTFSQIVINEVMYHAADSDLEYIELYNAGNQQVDLSGWYIQDSQDDNRFTIPNRTTLSPQQYLVIADNRDLFRETYNTDPTLSGIPFNLSNSDDSVRLFDASGTLIESLTYSDRAPWPDAADGDGASLERRNAALSAELPAAWAASTEIGTPGAVNSAHVEQLTPLILSVDHHPRVPQPNESIAVTAHVIDAIGQVASVKLYYGTNRGTNYQSIAMIDDGMHGDGEANDGIYGAEVEGSSEGTLLRFYIEAANSNNLTAEMPEQGVEQPYMTVYERALPDERVSVFRIVMRPEVNEQFLARYQTDEYFPATFYENDEVYYRIDIRHRGRTRSQNGRFKIRFPYDDLFRDQIRRLNFNGTDTGTILREYLSFQLYQDAGLPNLETELVRFHINGESTRGTPYRVMIENPDSQFLRRRQYFDDDDGNLYKTTLDGTPQNKATWRYIGDDPDLYRGCYIKQTNESADDFSDIIQFCKVLTESNTEDPDFADKVRSVLDVDEFIRWMAVSAIVAHWDSPFTDHGQNYVLYDDPDTSQFNVLAWDLNGTFSYSSNHDDLNYRKLYTHIRSTKFPAINKILNHPEFGAQYYRDIDLLLRTLFTENAMQQRIDEARNAIQAGRNSVSFLNTYVSHRIQDLGEWINNDRGIAFLSKPVYQAQLGEPYRYRIVAVDYRQKPPLSLRVIDGPAWLSLDETTGGLSGIPPETGRFEIAVEAQKSGGESIRQEYTLQVVDSTPRLILNFNEDSGNAIDLSEYGNNAGLRGGAQYVSGRLGNAVSVGGRNSYLEIPHDDSLNLTGSITVEAWIRPNRISNGNPVILTKGDENRFNYTLMLGYGPWSWDAMEPCFMPHRFDIENRVYYGRKEIEAQLRSNQWVHIAGTYNSAKELVHVYTNNYPIVHSSARPQMVVNNQSLLIGLDNNQSFSGLIDDVRILPFDKQAFAAGLCLSQIDVSGISSAQDRIALSLSDLRTEPINTGGYCLYLVNADRWIPLPKGQLMPGNSMIWWLDDLGITEPLQQDEMAALYPIDSLGTASKEWILDQVVWGNAAPSKNDPGVQAAVWLPNRAVSYDHSRSTSLSLQNFADNDDMDRDWTSSPQELDGPMIQTLLIENGADRTENHDVRLQIDADNPGSGWTMRISNTPAMGSEWIPFDDDQSWTLAPGNGIKTVYMQALDAAGKRSMVYAAAIEVAPNTAVQDWQQHGMTGD